MLPQSDDYAGGLPHGEAIERGHSVFAHSRNAALVVFTYDHEPVSRLLRSAKIEPPKRTPVAVDPDGELRLTIVTQLTTE